MIYHSTRRGALGKEIQATQNVILKCFLDLFVFSGYDILNR